MRSIPNTRRQRSCIPTTTCRQVDTSFSPVVHHPWRARLPASMALPNLSIMPPSHIISGILHSILTPSPSDIDERAVIALLLYRHSPSSTEANITPLTNRSRGLWRHSPGLGITIPGPQRLRSMVLRHSTKAGLYSIRHQRQP